MRRALVLAILVVAAGVAVVLLRPAIMGTPGTSPAATPVPDVATSTDVVAEARAIPIRTASLGAAVSGTVTKVVALGAKVAAGDTLIALDSGVADAQLVGAQAALNAATAQRDQADAAGTQADAAIAIAQAGVTQAEAGVAQAKAGVDQAKAGVAQAKAGVDQAKAGVAQAKAGVAQAKAGVDQAKATRDILPSGASNAQKRQAEAVVNGAQAQLDAATARVDAANAALDAADAALDAADAALDAANATVDVAQATLVQARAQAESANAAKVVAKHAADVAEAERVRASSAVDAAEEARALYTVTAPFAGTVASVLIHEGELLPPGIVVVRVADMSGWTFETTDLAEAGAARIAPGDTATITVEDVESVQIQGRVRQIGAFGEDRQGDVVFRVVIEPTTTVPSLILWNTVATATIHANPALRGQGATP
jgi:multidrug efflux pump subunit AcrA (membrane-fusion protein)